MTLLMIMMETAFDVIILDHRIECTSNNCSLSALFTDFLSAASAPEAAGGGAGEEDGAG